MEKTLGKLIVIDGIDGAGKGTQTQILIDRLLQDGYKVKMADFPQYDSASSDFIKEYLNGKYGSAEKVGPFRASALFAVDRYDASFKIKAWLDEGYIVISNRYVSSNMGHQGGKIADKAKRKKYMDWVYALEYNLFQIPKPDLNIILHVDAEIGHKLVENKAIRSYLCGEKRDIHEADIDHLRAAEKVYLEIAESYPNFTLIDCAKNGQILKREEIHEMIWNKVLALIDPERLQKNSKEKFQINIERISPLAKLPSKAYSGDAAFDLYSSEYASLSPGNRAIIATGIKMAIPENYAGLIWDKSGIAKNGIHVLGGVIDSGYRGEIKVNLINLGEDILNIEPGQKIAQILIQKIENPEIIESIVNDKTNRGEGGYGSSGLF